MWISYSYTTSIHTPPVRTMVHVTRAAAEILSVPTPHRRGGAEKNIVKTWEKVEMNWKIIGKTHVFEGFKFQWVDHCLMFFDDMFDCFCSDVFY